MKTYGIPIRGGLSSSDIGGVVAVGPVIDLKGLVGGLVEASVCVYGGVWVGVFVQWMVMVDMEEGQEC